jgi:MerR family transcriptional regulator/heat shock protein HspR
MPDVNRAVYVISVAAEIAGVHPQTLRIYERKGLLDPARTVGGSRRYSEGDIEQLRRIQDLTAAGLNLEGVKRVLELESEVDRLRAEVAAARQAAREAVEQTHRRYRRELVPVAKSVVVFDKRR